MSDPFYNDVVALFGFEGGTIVDESPLAQTVTGETDSTHALSSTQAKFGTQSLRVPELSGISVPPVTIGSAFTVEGWFWFETLVSNRIYALVAQFEYGSSSTWMMEYYHHDTPSLCELRLVYNTDGGGRDFIASAVVTPMTTGNWVYLGTDFDGSDYRFYTSTDGHIGTVAGVAPAATTKRLTIGTELSFDFPNGLFDGYIDEVRVTADVARYQGTWTEPTEAFSRVYAPPPPADTPYEGSVMELVNMGEGGSHTAIGELYLSSTTEPVSAADEASALRQALAALTEAVRSFSYSSIVRAIAASAVAGVGASVQAAPTVGVVNRDRVPITAAAAPNWRLRLAISEAVQAADRMSSAEMVLATEGLDVTAVTSAAAAMRVIESLGLTEALAPTATYGLALSDGLSLTDPAASFFTISASESMTLSDALAVLYRGAGAAAESLGVTADVTPRLLAKVTAPEELSVSDQWDVQALYTALVTETLDVDVAFLDPGGDVTTWAMNASTGAVSEYTNYKFNSFAEAYGSYLAAGPDGIYRLDGGDDNGDDIIAKLRGGYIQFGGPRLSRLKAAYVAMRGAGEVILRLDTGDGSVYNYRVTTQNMKTTKVNMGKGQRARYFAYELETLGQDFDLDTLEFVPVVMQRRV